MPEHSLLRSLISQGAKKWLNRMKCFWKYFFPSIFLQTQWSQCQGYFFSTYAIQPSLIIHLSFVGVGWLILSHVNPKMTSVLKKVEKYLGSSALKEEIHKIRNRCFKLWVMELLISFHCSVKRNLENLSVTVIM